jgi:WD40 repeat protein
VNERWLALTDGSKIRLIDGLTGREVFAAEGRGPIAWHPGGAQLASGNGRGVTIWSVPAGKPIRSWEAHGAQITAIAWSPDGERLATGGRDTSLRVWNPSTGRQLFRVENVFNSDPDWFTRLWWEPRGTRLATSDQNKPLTLRDASNGKILRQLEEPRVFGNSSPSHGGRWLAVTNPSVPLIKLFDISNDYRLQYQIPISGSLLNVSWSRDDRLLAVSSLNVTGFEMLTVLNDSGTQNNIGNIRIYDMSPLFVDKPADLFAISRQKVSRPLTPDECRKYLGTDVCPPRP